jgi:hypothetical protein
VPYPTDVYRVNINATVGSEIMVHTVWIKDRASQIGMTTQKAADQVRDAWADFYNGTFSGSYALRSALANNVAYTGVTAYEVDQLGRAIDVADAPFSGLQAPAGTNRLPEHLALCVSLLTGLPGRSNRGRVFLGGLATAVMGADARVVPTVRDGLAAGYARFVRDVRDKPLAPDEMDVAVVSPTKGTSRPVTAVRVGNIFDVMNSRRSRLQEVYASANIP